MTNAESPICEVCERAPAEGFFGRDDDPTAVCRVCAECAIDDGHMKSRDFWWWSARFAPEGDESAN